MPTYVCIYTRTHTHVFTHICLHTFGMYAGICVWYRVAGKVVDLLKDRIVQINVELLVQSF
jgi:hypothetical protein